MFAEILRSKLQGVAIVLTDQQVAQLEKHYQLMLRWNRSLNLTTITDLEAAVERHYCESLLLAAQLPLGPSGICDIGSGPGFPGLPIAVYRPDCSVTLLESHQRKAVFLKEAARELPNVSVIAKRAEKVEGKFDLAVSRAVSFEDLRTPLKFLAPAADLLTGGEAPDWAEWDWAAPVVLPWGRNRFLRCGKRK